MIRTNLFLLLTLAVCRPATAGAEPLNDVVETAVAAESFQTLVAALKAANLVDALKADGPFTVFAPTDDAFAKLPRGTVARLLKPENRDRLRAILTYHVVPGRLEAADLLASPSPTSLNGAPLPVSLRNGRVGIQKASLVTPNILCSNGIIHVIDAVLLPIEEGVLDVAKRAGTFGTLLAAVEAAGLRNTLTGTGPFTVFAPTDEAFAKLPEGTLPELLKPANRAKLAAVLARHVVRVRITAANALRAGSVRTLAGDAVQVALRDGVLRVGEATLVNADLEARNGIIHVIDRVLLPPPADRRRAVRDTLMLAIERGVPVYNAGRPGACASIYEVAVRAVLAMAGAELLPEERAGLESALERLSHASGDQDRAWLLRRAMDQVLASLEARPDEPTEKAKSTMKTKTFQPLIEAPLPRGFPAPGPVGEVVLKEYPKYRAARAQGGNSFWTLFSHIKRNKIAMTAPVEMAMDGDDGDLKRQNMAFLYASPALGQPGSDGRVDVVDLGPVRVLSFGIRGPLTDQKKEQARQAIEARLRGESKTWKRSGEWRLLGYNSPMVQAERRFWELQLPVARLEEGRTP